METNETKPEPAMKMAISKPPSSKFKKEKTVDAIFEDINKLQQQAMHLHLRGAFIAIAMGQLLLSLRSMLPHGTVQKTIIERFCRPNNISLKTAERYQSLANATEILLEHLRRDNPEFNDLSDEEVLQKLPLTKAYELIRRLSRIEVGEPSKIGRGEPRPDPNRWETPKVIVDCVLELFKVVDCDPCALPGCDPFSAVEKVYLPVNGVASETRWFGRIWINPGLKSVNHNQFTERLLQEFESKNVREGLILLPACTNAYYANKLRLFPRAFTTKPLTVSGPNLPQHLLKLPLMIVFVGPKERFADFASAFSSELFDIFIRVN